VKKGDGMGGEGKEGERMGGEGREGKRSPRMYFQIFLRIAYGRR